MGQLLLEQKEPHMSEPKGKPKHQSQSTTGILKHYYSSASPNPSIQDIQESEALQPQDLSLSPVDVTLRFHLFLVLALGFPATQPFRLRGRLEWQGRA